MAEIEYGIDPTTWYSPNEIVDRGLLFGKSKRYLFDVIRSGQLKAVNTSDTTKPQWKIIGSELIKFIKSIEGGKNADSNNTEQIV